MVVLRKVTQVLVKASKPTNGEGLYVPQVLRHKDCISGASCSKAGKLKIKKEIPSSLFRSFEIFLQKSCLNQ